MNHSILEYLEAMEKKDRLIDDTNDCIMLKRAKPRHKVSISGKRQPIYRHIIEEAQGTLSSNIVVRHKCDNPCCFNPHHLETGSHKQNMADRRISW
jgi:hypothetical protein